MEKEAGWIFEDILLDWKYQKKKYNGKINVEIAFKLLNPKFYENGVKFFRENIFSNKKKIEHDDVLKTYLEKIGLKDEEKFKKFIDENKNEFVDAKRESCHEYFVAEYFRYGHSSEK